MSIEAAKLCIERVKTDEDFAKRVSDCKDPDAQMAFVRAAGYEFTTQEMRQNMGDMDDDELDAVAGGGKASGYQNQLKNIHTVI